MAIPPTTHEALSEAIARFDREQRDTPAWADWQNNEAHRYAIDRDGRLYPVKQIVSMATGIPVTDFSGGVGPGQANEFVITYGFNIVPLRRRNPPWVRDELILALDLYLSRRAALPTHESPEIAALSDTLSRLARVLGHSSGGTYRNANGVYMKLMNFRSLDAYYTNQGKVGLTSIGREDRTVWDDLASDPERCHALAEQIKQGTTFAEDEEFALGDFEDEGIEAEEGAVLTRLHRRRERDRKIVEKKKQSVLSRNGRLSCEACGFDFGQHYGALGDGFIECHHIRPLSTVVTTVRTAIADLGVVCANCHRMIHRRRPWLSIAELKAAMSSLLRSK